jgi:hypothetical protein
MNSKKAVIIIVLLEVIMGASAVWWDGLSLEALHTTTRFSGRLSLLIFSLIFLWINYPKKLIAWLSEKFYFVFAIAHGIHLIELLFYISISGNPLIPIRLLGGFVAYAMIFVMPFLYDAYLSGKFTVRQFAFLKIFYQYYLWVIFFMTYLPRVRGTLANVGGNYWEFVVLLCWVLFMLFIKATSLFKVSLERNA